MHEETLLLLNQSSRSIKLNADDRVYLFCFRPSLTAVSLLSLHSLSSVSFIAP